MVGHAPIISDCFVNEVELDESILNAHEVRGMDNAPDKLADLDRLAQDEISVITLLEVE